MDIWNNRGSLASKIIPSVGINYYNSLGGFGGIEIGMSELLNINAEYIASKENINSNYYSTINLGVRFKFEDKVVLEFHIKDIGNRLGAARGIKFSYSNLI